MATSASSRSAGSSRSFCSAQLGLTARWNRRAPRARARGQPLGQTLPNSDDRSVPRPPQRCASESKRPHCQCCRISDLLAMTPYLAALDRRRHHRRRPTRRSRPQHRRRSPELHRRPRSANNNSAKMKCRRRPAAAAPARAGRSARRNSVSQLAGIGARLVRAREGSDYGEFCQIPLIVRCRGRRSAERAGASALTVSAADFPIY